MLKINREYLIQSDSPPHYTFEGLQPGDIFTVECPYTNEHTEIYVKIFNRNKTNHHAIRLSDWHVVVIPAVEEVWKYIGDANISFNMCKWQESAI